MHDPYDETWRKYEPEPVPANWSPEMPAGEDFHARLERAETLDPTLKKLRNEAMEIGDYSKVVAYRMRKERCMEGYLY